MYFSAFNASFSVAKLPILINVGVDEKLGFATRGVLKTSPRVPEPFDSGTNTLYFPILLSAYLGVIYFFSTHRHVLFPEINPSNL